MRVYCKKIKILLRCILLIKLAYLYSFMFLTDNFNLLLLYSGLRKVFLVDILRQCIVGTICEPISTSLNLGSRKQLESILIVFIRCK